jgi:hypothetical protein
MNIKVRFHVVPILAALILKSAYATGDELGTLFDRGACESFVRSFVSLKDMNAIFGEKNIRVNLTQKGEEFATCFLVTSSSGMTGLVYIYQKSKDGWSWRGTIPSNSKYRVISSQNSRLDIVTGDNMVDKPYIIPLLQNK